jgi:endonuclease YncB( thermonuclease family)
VGITDGDTLTVLDGHSQQHKVRIAGIDAPEREQAFFEKSRQNLARVSMDQRATVHWYKKDRKRLVANVFVSGYDVGLTQVRDGMAWHFKRFEREQSSKARAEYTAAELDAKVNRRGIWGDQAAMPPWEWRAKKKAAPQRAPNS